MKYQKDFFVQLEQNYPLKKYSTLSRILWLYVVRVKKSKKYLHSKKRGKKKLFKVL